MHRRRQAPSASEYPLPRFPNDSNSAYFPSRANPYNNSALFAAAAQLDLISERFQEAVDKCNAPAQFFVAELAEEREKPRRLDDRFLVASECFTGRHSHALQHLRVDGC